MSIDTIEDFNPIYFDNKQIYEINIFKNQIQLIFDKKNYIYIESICELIEKDSIIVFQNPYDDTLNIKDKLKNRIVKNIIKDHSGSLVINFEGGILFKIYKSNTPYYESYQVFSETDWHVE